jgi:hypothetical protein
MAITIQKHTYEIPVSNIRSGLAPLVARVSEWFWFCLCLVLFVVLGPFGAPVALMVLVKLGLEENSHREPESVKAG